MTFVYGMLAMWLILGAIILISDWFDSGGFWVQKIGWATGIVMFPYLVFITGPIVLLKFIRRNACKSGSRGKGGEVK